MAMLMILVGISCFLMPLKQTLAVTYGYFLALATAKSGITT